MRRGREVNVIRDDEGKIVVVSLGADFCAEHEWGIKRIKQDFGIPAEVTRENAGLDYRKIRQLPTPRSEYSNRLYTRDFKIPAYDREKRKNATVHGRALLFYSDVDSPSLAEKYRGEMPGELRPYDVEFEFSSAWSEGDFGLLANAKDPRNVESIDRLMLAFQDLDVAVWLGGGGVFENAGLCFGIVSRMDQSHFEQWKATDLDGINLKEAAAATGIYKKLEVANCRFFACSPKWASEFKSTKNGEVKTKHEVIFFLNPMEQRSNNFGWFTVEDLEAWTRGKGPIPMKKP